MEAELPVKSRPRYLIERPCLLAAYRLRSRLGPYHHPQTYQHLPRSLQRPHKHRPIRNTRRWVQTELEKNRHALVNLISKTMIDVTAMVAVFV